MTYSSRSDWKALLQWGEKAEASNGQLWDNRPFLKCPLQRPTPENQAAQGTLWTADMPAAWLEEPNIAEEEELVAAFSHKVRLEQRLPIGWAPCDKLTNRARTNKVTAALVTLISLNEPGVVYDADSTTRLDGLTHQPVLPGPCTCGGDAELPSKAGEHCLLEVQLGVLQVLLTFSDETDPQEQPPIKPPDEHDTHKWMAYYLTVDGMVSQQAQLHLILAMRQVATECGLHGTSQHEQEATTPHQNLRSLISAIWREKRGLHTTIHSQHPHTRQSAQRIAARSETTRQQLSAWHKRRAKDLSPEQQR